MCDFNAMFTGEVKKNNIIIFDGFHANSFANFAFEKTEK
jgi:hypothetical protein